MINFDEYSKRIYLTGAAPNDSVQIYLLTYLLISQLTCLQRN